jgi:hypothetical protein
VFLDEDDDPDDDLLEALADAQAATGADVVTASVRPADDPDGQRLFLGDPGALGLVENQYGVIGLVRRSLVTADASLDEGVDPDWLLFARLALSGARIVSIPDPLARCVRKPGRIGDVPGDGVAVLRLFEESGAVLHDLPQLAATLAATLQRAGSIPASVDGAKHGRFEHGLGRLARRARARLR